MPEHPSTMQRLIILNGPAGVGKTTVGRLLAATVRNGVCIHGDDLRNFIVTMEDGTVEGGLGYRNAATLASNFLSAGYDLIVVDYVFEHPRYLDHFMERAPQDVPMHLFTLWAPLPLIEQRERTRPDRKRLGDRVRACYASMHNNLDQLGCVVMNKDIEPATLAKKIWTAAEAGQGLISRNNEAYHG
jgi:predicted kinase